MDTKIYKRNNNVSIEQDGKIIMLIPARTFRFEPEGINISLRDNEIKRSLNVVYNEVLDETGTPVGDFDNVVDYLSNLVGGFSTGSGGSESVTTLINNNDNTHTYTNELNLQTIINTSDNHSGVNIIAENQKYLINENKEMMVSYLSVDGILEVEGILTII